MPAIPNLRKLILVLNDAGVHPLVVAFCLFAVGTFTLAVLAFGVLMIGATVGASVQIAADIAWWQIAAPISAVLMFFMCWRFIVAYEGAAVLVLSVAFGTALAPALTSIMFLPGTANYVTPLVASIDAYGSVGLMLLYTVILCIGRWVVVGSQRPSATGDGRQLGPTIVLRQTADADTCPEFDR